MKGCFLCLTGSHGTGNLLLQLAIRGLLGFEAEQLGLEWMLMEGVNDVGGNGCRILNLYFLAIQHDVFSNTDPVPDVAELLWFLTPAVSFPCSCDGSLVSFHLAFNLSPVVRDERPEVLCQ